MSEEFKRQLNDYANGKLTGIEKEKLELELEKMESYQAYLNEFMGDEEDNQRLKEGTALATSFPIKEATLLRRGKWKARLQNALTAIGILIAFTTVSAILTGLFYSLGDRARTYQDVIASAIALSRPNMTISGSTNSNAFFTMDYKGTFRKKIGGTFASVGDFNLKFLLGLPSTEQTTWRNDSSSLGAEVFDLPDTKPVSSDQAWTTLEKLPEGTVAEAFVSLNRMVTTDELLQMLNGKTMEPVWFAAFTGQENRHGDFSIVMHPVGFPAIPLWHPEDMKITSHTEEKRGWFGKIVTESSSSPAVQTHGDGALREKNFLDTLHLLQQYSGISKRLAPWLALDPTVTYLESNGVKLYGVVLTGPTKELLKLKTEPWVSSIRVGEVRLWNW
ncbi:anti-sigma factor [Paenibacillus sp. UNC451MF]|uniref:anti-sigma factor n=1 Tax=Paenibacillus sp. UNC451MF TaxID=1449063 RepID=UPI00048F28F4|nr:anti-sigma factor [Paenibacillus sp. UNC451MF]